MDTNLAGAPGAHEPVGAFDSMDRGTLAAEAEQSFHHMQISSKLQQMGLLDVDQPLYIAARR